LHFNKKREKNTNTNTNTNTIRNDFFDEDNFNMYRLLAIDTITIDRYSRLTLTNEVKNVLDVEAQDKIAVYQDTYNPDELLFRIQRGGRLVDTWKLKRKNMSIDYNEQKSVAVPSIVAPITDRKWTENSGNSPTVSQSHKSEIKNIMIVDDEQDVLYNFQMTLSEEGYNVISFSKSKEAIKHLIDSDNLSTYYDLVIIDIRMPELNGIQLYQILKIINKNIKVLFISALDAADEILSMFPEIDSSDIIRKPVSKGYIISKVMDIISSS
jgi:CheY-like chemotaxis protein